MKNRQFFILGIRWVRSPIKSLPSANSGGRFFAKSSADVRLEQIPPNFVTKIGWDLFVKRNIIEQAVYQEKLRPICVNLSGC